MKIVVERVIFFEKARPERFILTLITCLLLTCLQVFFHYGTQYAVILIDHYRFTQYRIKQ